MNEQTPITLTVSLQEANIIIESLGLNRLNDILPLYMKVRGQAEEQVNAAQAPKQEPEPQKDTKLEKK